MKRLLLIAALFLPSLAGAQVFRFQDLCKVGGQAATVQGLASSNDLIGSYPGCTVNVFISGSGTHATIYSDSGMTPLANPFTADIVTGAFGFYAAAGCYDVVTSGAGMPSPQTASAICLATSVTAGTVTSVTQTNNASSLITVGIANPTTTPAFTFGLTQFGAHAFWGNGTGSTATPSATVIGVGDLPFTYSGNTTKLVTGGTISGTGATLCTDASGNATTSGCSSGTSGYNTVQDEGTPLTQRAVINFTGAGISCVDNSGSLRTDCTVAASTISGSGTATHIPQWTAGTVLGDSNFIVSGDTLQSGGVSTFTINSPTVGSGSAKAILITSGPSTSGSSSDSSGAVTLSSSSAGASGNSSGTVSVRTGAATGGSGNSGNVLVGSGNAGGAPGDIQISPGKGTSQDAVVYCSPITTDAGCNIVMGTKSTGAFAGLTVGTGVPSGTCQMPLTNPKYTAMPILYLRTDPASASTFLYVCIPPSTWTAVTVP